MNRPGKDSIRRLSYCSVFVVLAWFAVGCGPDNYQARFAASWSPDGTKVALCVNNEDPEGDDSGLWIIDASTGARHRIVRLDADSPCLHPQWSPSGEELLFGVLEKLNGAKENSDDYDTLSIWTVRADGTGLRRVADAPTATDGDGYLSPNSIAWGMIAGTVYFPFGAGDRVTAVSLDLHSGVIRPLLPAFATKYTLEFSPSRNQAASLLIDKEEGDGKNEKRIRANVYVSDSVTQSWRKLGTLHLDSNATDTLSTLIYWSPDSSKFVVPEIETGSDSGDLPGHYLRVFDVLSGDSYRLCAAQPNTEIFWSQAGDALVFSGSVEVGGESFRGAFRVEVFSGRLLPLVADEDICLVAWNSDEGRVYFYRRFESEDAKEGPLRKMKFYSCASDGPDLREISDPLPSENCGWVLSPVGNRLLLFSSSEIASLVDLRSHSHMDLLFGAKSRE